MRFNTVRHSKTICTLISMSLIFCAALEAQTGGLRYTVSVAEFENNSNWEGQIQLGQAWVTVLTDLLHQDGRFIVLGDSSMRALALEEQDAGVSGRFSTGSKTPSTGRMTSAQLLFKGEIVHAQTNIAGQNGGLRIKKFSVGIQRQVSEITAVVHVVDSSTGQVVASTQVTGKEKSRGGKLRYRDGHVSGEIDGKKKSNMMKAISSAANEAINRLVQEIPQAAWSGTVVQVEKVERVSGAESYGDSIEESSTTAEKSTDYYEVLINRGIREGVKEGQVFVTGKANVLIDPDDGSFRGVKLREVARLRVIRVDEKISVCEVIEGDVHAVRRGLRVQLP